MTLARTWSVGLAGVHGAMVDVEVDLSAGVPGVVLVGLPDAVVRQSVDRVRAAVVNAGGKWPLRRITIGLSPASMPKQGSGFDLALATAILAADGAVPAESVGRLVLLGELGLDGSVRAVRGVLPAVLAAARAGHPTVVVPVGNAGEAALVDGVEVLAAGTLAEVVAHLEGRARLPRHTRPSLPPMPPGPDLGDVVGQPIGRRAVEVAAAGGHHLFLSGPPGAGKTMLAERLPGVLPALDEQAALEVTAIHSVAGTLPPDFPMVTRPTFEAPHHSATMAALVGGGSGPIRPGALCRAHRGVLFLDKATRRDVRTAGAPADTRQQRPVQRVRRQDMTTTDSTPQLEPTSEATPAAAPEPAPVTVAAGRRRRPRWALPAAALVLGLAVGAGTMAAATDPTRSEEYQALEQRLDTEEKRAASAREQAERAGENAAAASRAAEQQAAELLTRERLVAEREAAVTVVEQRIAATSIGEGTWTVGRDVEPGTYRTSEAVFGQCYWGIYRSGSNGSDILDNDIVTGGFPTVQLREGQDFTNRDCGTFVKQ